MTIQQSKAWKTKSGDPLWPNGWECPCGTTYRTKYGVVIELVTDRINGILYCKAPVPDDHINDMRAMMHEKLLKPLSPEQLYNAVPVCKPSLTSLIVQKKDGFGQVIENEWTFSSLSDYQSLPQFDWYQVFNMAGYELPQKPLSNKERKVANAKCWAEEEAAKKHRMIVASSSGQ